MEDENNGKIVDQKPTRSGSQRRVSVSPKTQAVLTSCGLDGHVVSNYSNSIRKISNSEGEY